MTQNLSIWTDYMHVSTRRRRSKRFNSRTRASLLGASRELFESGGYANVTVEQILVRAQVSRATFYHYFPDKKAIFLEVVAELNSDIELLRSTFSDCEETPYRRMVADQIGFFELWSRYTNTFRDGLALTIADPEGQKLIREIRERNYPRIDTRAPEGLPEGQAFPGDQRKLVPVVLGGLSTNFAARFFASEDIFNRSNTSFADGVLAVAEAWYRIVFAEPAPEHMTCYEVELLREQMANVLVARERQRAYALDHPSTPQDGDLPEADTRIQDSITHVHN